MLYLNFFTELYQLSTDGAIREDRIINLPQITTIMIADN